MKNEFLKSWLPIALSVLNLVIIILVVILWVLYLPSIIQPNIKSQYNEDKNDFEISLKNIKTRLVSISEQNLKNDSLVALQQDFKILLAKYELLKQNYDKEVANQKQSFENESKDFINQVKQQNLFILLLVAIVGGGTIIGIITSIILFFKQLHFAVNQEVSKQVQSKVDEQKESFEKLSKSYNEQLEIISKDFKQSLAEIAATNPETIKKIIDNTNQDIQLIKNAKIKVLSHSKHNKAFVMEFFKAQGFGFKIPEFVDEVNYLPDNVIHNDYDLLILDDEDGNFEPSFLEKYTTDNKKVFFYFGPQKMSNKDNLGFANAKSQFYQNILNLLRLKQLNL